MQDDPRYGDVVAEVAASSIERLAAAVAAGIADERICSTPASASARPPSTTSRCCARLAELRGARRAR